MKINIHILLSIIFFSVAILFTFTQSAYAGQARLRNKDCIKCHQKEVATIKRNGGKHKTDVSCLDCHVQHLPDGTDTIAKCSRCHSGEAHFRLKDCLLCHSDPHEPLALKFGKGITRPCLACHVQQGRRLKDNPSKHSKLACTFCHTSHSDEPDCSRCHKPDIHGKKTAAEKALMLKYRPFWPKEKKSECLGCHPVHQPLVINYPLETTRNFCTPCHKKEGKLLAKTTTRHRTFTCAFCHRGTHKFIPKCENCHGKPHSAELHKKTPDCLTCHMDAHDLVK